jgi:hypothetical protein
MSVWILGRFVSVSSFDRDDKSGRFLLDTRARAFRFLNTDGHSIATAE